MQALCSEVAGIEDEVELLAEDHYDGEEEDNEELTATEAPPKPKLTQAERLLALRLCYGKASKTDLDKARSSKD
eukprot:2151493-Amphidinium_carterae.1